MTLEHLPRRLLHLEGLAVLGAALVLYFEADYGWLPLGARTLDVSRFGVYLPTSGK